MKFTQRNITIGLLILLNLSIPIALAGPRLIYTGTYSPPISTGWQDFELHYAITSFWVDLTSLQNYNHFEINIDMLKLGNLVILDVTNETSRTQLNVTQNMYFVVESGGWFYFDSYSLNDNITEISLTIVGFNNTNSNTLLDSIFLRFGSTYENHIVINYPNSDNNSPDSLYVNFYMNIVEKNGTGSVFIGENYANFFGDSFTRPKVEMNSPGNYSTSLKIKWLSIPISNDESFSGGSDLTSMDYSQMTWDVRGKYKFEITSYESYSYFMGIFMSYLYVYGILALDIVIFIFLSVKFIINKFHLSKSS